MPNHDDEGNSEHRASGEYPFHQRRKPRFISQRNKERHLCPLGQYFEYPIHVLKRIILQTETRLLRRCFFQFFAEKEVIL